MPDGAFTGRRLKADGPSISHFVDALFRYADEHTFASIRAFPDNGRKDETPVVKLGVPLTGGTWRLVRDAMRHADECANRPEPVVFCPPVATFSSPERAREVDLANGLALSVECDRAPAAARARLEALLGPATVVAASGGTWTDPETGEVEDKLHLHWRLTEPTREAADHARLKRARGLATTLVGGDATNKPPVHPIRWPGSWHRKGAPRLARIVERAEVEVELTDALERLEEAVEAAGLGAEAGTGARAGETPSGEERDTAELISAVLAGADYQKGCRRH
jgi:hypothetical protein